MSLTSATPVSSTPTSYTGGASASAPINKYIGAAGDLTLAEMMVWLNNTIKKTDSDVRQQMNDVEAKKAMNEQLGAIISDMRKMENDKLTDTGREGGKFAADYSNYKSTAWFKELPKEAKDAFTVLMEDIPAGTDTLADVEKIKLARQTLSDVVQANSSSNETAMIKLQSAISARGQAIQLVSNMLNALNESAKSIVGNVR